MEWWGNGIFGMKSGWSPHFNFRWWLFMITRSHTVKPGIPTFHHSSAPWHWITAKPVISELAPKIRLLMLD